MDLGYFLSCEEYSPPELLEQARLAEKAGFTDLWISDHFLPWNHEQGQSPFVWSMIGALSQVCDLPVTTAVTCPTTRIHPTIVAQAAATSAVLLGGRFTLGVGTGEALNEHIHADVWPAEAERLEMLEEAVGIIRRLWSGEVVSHRGPHYRVDRARLFTLPAHPPEIHVSAFGPRALATAARVGDGFVTTMPDEEAVAAFRNERGPGAPAAAGVKVAYAPTREEGVGHAHRLWANAGLPGELAQILPTPEHLEQAASLVPREAIGDSVAAGPGVEDHREALRPYAEAGFDRLYVANMGPHYREMIELYGREIIPALT